MPSLGLMVKSTPRAALFAALLWAGCILGGQAAQATKPDLGAAAGAFVERFMAEARVLLADDKLGDGERAKVFRGLLDSGFDFEVITRYVLDEHWYQASSEDRSAFRRVFADYLFTIYEGHLGGFDEVELEVLAARQKGDKGAQVRSRVLNSGDGSALDVEWRLWQADGDWRIVDLLVQGVSLVKAYREQFDSLVDDSPGDVAAVLAALQDIAPAAGPR